MQNALLFTDIFLKIGASIKISREMGWNNAEANKYNKENLLFEMIYEAAKPIEMPSGVQNTLKKSIIRKTAKPENSFLLLMAQSIG